MKNENRKLGLLVKNEFFIDQVVVWSLTLTAEESYLRLRTRSLQPQLLRTK